MRILFVSYEHALVSPGGSQQLAYEMFQTAREQGHDAYLVGALDHGRAGGVASLDEPLTPAGDSQYFYVPHHYDARHFSVGDWRSLSSFRDLVASLRPDAIQFHHYHNVGVEAIRVARLAAPDAVICLTFHEMLAICMAEGRMLLPSGDLCYEATPLACYGCFPHLRPGFFSLRAERLHSFFHECDNFVFPSQFLADRYLAWGLDPSKCRVIANGQRHPAPTAPTLPRHHALNRFGFFGQDLDHKGLAVVFEALLTLVQSHRVPECGIEFLVNGANRQYATEAYRRTLDRLRVEISETAGSQVRIRELGAYGRQQLAERMRMVDWVVVPSTWWEVFGLVVSEAWMFGRPVIVSDIAGLGERVMHDVNGLKFPPRDSAALADLIASAIGDTALWERLREAGRPELGALEMFEAYLALWAS